MRGLVPRIPIMRARALLIGIAGTSPAMTGKRVRLSCVVARSAKRDEAIQHQPTMHLGIERAAMLKRIKRSGLLRRLKPRRNDGLSQRCALLASLRGSRKRDEASCNPDTKGSGGNPKRERGSAFEG